jgi:hypothetical protein
MTVKSADKKPEKYVGPDGKPKIRMVSVDKEVVKNEAYDEPQGQAKRIASPLQKARMDKEKADRDREGKLKSEGKTFDQIRNEAYSMKEMVCESCGDTYGKPTNETCMYDAYDMAGENWCSRKEYIAAQKKNEANTYVGQRDKMKIIDRKPHPDGGHIVTLQTQAGKTIKRHLKNGKVKDMNEAKLMSDEDVAKMVAKRLDNRRNADSYDQIAVIKDIMNKSPKQKSLATDREFIDDVLDILFKKYRFRSNQRRESVELDEAKFSPKHVKMAIGIASDKRYKGGNMTGAVKAMDKMKPGISNHPQVSAVLKRQNEDMNEETLDELTAAEKKLVNQMYDKKGNLTPLGKRVMDHGKKAAGIKETFGRARFAQQLKKKGIDVSKLHNQNVKDAAAAKERQKAAQTDYDNFKNKKESVDEVLDTPKAMDSYHNKAKAQSDRARNSATAKLVRGTKDISKEKDVIRKREKGMDMATNVRAKQFRKSIGRGYSGEATIPDGQTALTKRDPIKKNDMDKLSAIRKMLDREKAIKK